MILKWLLLFFTVSFIDAQFSYYRAPQSCFLPRIPHGRARVRQRGNLVKFSCLGRYTLVGNKYATCKNGQWDVPLPVCIKSGCAPLEEVKNSVNMTLHNNSWIVFFCLPGHQLVGSPVVYCNGIHWNSTAPACVDGSAKVPTECGFEKPDICGWKLDELHDFDWLRWNKKTPSSFLQTGPAYDHTFGENGTGYYMYIESTGRVENDTARLISPVYEADLAKNACFVFYYHMFGRSMGGLLVYQKPEKVPLYQMLTGAQKANYTLFEQWGDQGNEWYSSVTMLKDYSDDFQIVIEGIRGHSFMSDIAIDDVSIQHGENCTKAMNAATTPPAVLVESCVGRCYQYINETVQRGCACDHLCSVIENCCPDFYDVCEFNGNDTRSSDDDDSTPVSSTSVALPQTQKLVATTTETLPPTTLTSTTTSTSTSTTISTTSTTTLAPSTTTTTTTTTTTRRPTTRYNRPTTTRRTTLSTTTKLPTTLRTTTSRVTRLPTTLPPTTKVARPTKKITTVVTPITSTTIVVVRTTKHVEVIDEKTQRAKTSQSDKVNAKQTKGMSGATVAMTVLLVCLFTCGALFAAFCVMRTSRGYAALARFRARTTQDPEVRYLKSDVDDDE